MSIASVGIWMDNFFRKRFLQNPDGPPGHLDCSAVAVFFTILLPRFPGHLTLRRMVFRLPGVMRCIRTSIRGLLKTISVTDGTLQAHFIPAPLDIARGIVHPQIWKPMLLDECRTSTNTELLQLIEMMRRIQIHTGRDLPLLVDMKIHASVLRFMYGAKLRSLDYRSHLERIPLLYGIWHPYKYCVHITFRRFFPVISWLLKPFITLRTKIPCHRKLIYMEKVFAGLLLASNVLKGLITEARDRLSTLRRPMNLENTVAYQKIQSLYSLLFVFTPALWAIGYGVRECTWAGAALDSGKTARTVLEHCLLLLVWTQDVRKKYEEEGKTPPHWTRMYDGLILSADTPFWIRQTLAGHHNRASHGGSEHTCEQRLHRLFTECHLKGLYRNFDSGSTSINITSQILSLLSMQDYLPQRPQR